MYKFTFISVVLCVFVGTFSSCTTIQTSEYAVEKFDTYVAGKQYYKAKKLLINLERKGVTSEALLERESLLVTKSSNEIRDLLSRVRSCAEKGDFLDAKNQLMWGRKEFPENKELIAQEMALLSLIDDRVSLLEVHKNMMDARHYLELQSLSESKKKLVKPTAREKFGSLKNKGKEKRYASSMLQCADVFMKKKNYTLAEECLVLGKNLMDSEELDQKFTSLNSIKKPKKKKRINIVKPKAEINSDELVTLRSVYLDQMGQQNWLGAKGTLSKLRKFSPNNDEYLDWSSTLEQTIQIKIEEDIALGRSLYSSGDVDQALAVWQSIASLAPQSAELQFHIDRAERFLENYRRLKNGN